MGLWDTLKTHAKAQFLDVIAWTDDTRDTIVYRFPIFNQAITANSKLVVREGQACVFVSEGVASEVFGPGTYTLDTRNAPITSFFQSIQYGLEYPYKGDVYFVNTTIFRDNRWGTPNPFMMRDAEFGPVRVRAFGQYDFRVTSPGVFLKQIVGTDGLFTLDEISGDLKKKLVSSIAAAINSARIPVLDIAAAHAELGDKVRGEFNPRFNETYGITITSLVIENVSLPPEVEAALDNRSKMGILGNLDAYAKMNAAEAIGTAAANPGLGGAGIGMGVGFGMGNMMGGMMGQMAPGQQQGQFNPHQGMQGPPAPAPPPLPTAASYHYNGPSGQGQLSLADVAARVVADRSGAHLVWMAGWPGWKPWSEVPEIAGAVPPVPAAPPPLPTATVRYHYSGASGQAELSAAEVAAKVAADPAGQHHVWREGFDAWKSAAEVPEIAAAAGPAGPPPLP